MSATETAAGRADATASPAHLVELRRLLHRAPELRFAEHRTAALLAERIGALGFTVRTGVGGTGVVATLAGAAPGPHLLLRADMDAMPVPDAKTVAWASTVPGVTHACGHDVHMAVILGVAERIAADGLRAGRVTVIFQPAEERPYGQPSGAEAMLADGALAGPPPDAILGLHAWPDLPAGTIGIDERIAMASKDAFSIALAGRGGHAATPSRSRDAILGIAELVGALHAGVARSVDAGDLIAFNIGTIAGGASQSVVAGSAEITGTLRTVDAAVRARLRAVIERIVTGIAAANELVATLRWADEMPAIVNDPRLVRRAHAVAAAVLGPAQVRAIAVPPMTADDFARFAELGPALYLKLGVAGGSPWPALHASSFDVDERCIGTGVAALHALAADLLARPLAEEAP